jgi:hypothetical protein
MKKPQPKLVIYPTSTLMVRNNKISFRSGIIAGPHYDYTGHDDHDDDDRPKSV